MKIDCCENCEEYFPNVINLNTYIKVAQQQGRDKNKNKNKKRKKK